MGSDWELLLSRQLFCLDMSVVLCMWACLCLYICTLCLWVWAYISWTQTYPLTNPVCPVCSSVRCGGMTASAVWWQMKQGFPGSESLLKCLGHERWLSALTRAGEADTLGWQGETGRWAGRQTGQRVEQARQAGKQRDRLQTERDRGLTAHATDKTTPVKIGPFRLAGHRQATVEQRRGEERRAKRIKRDSNSSFWSFTTKEGGTTL